MLFDSLLVVMVMVMVIVQVVWRFGASVVVVAECEMWSLASVERRKIGRGDERRGD